MESLEELKGELERATDIHIVKVIKIIMAGLKKLQKLHPKITHIFSGMGAWCFEGTAKGLNDDDGSIAIIEGYDFTQLLMSTEKERNSWSCVLEFNSDCLELAELCCYLYNVDQLNGSTCIDELNPKGVVFYCDSKTSINKAFLQSHLYNQLLATGLNVEFKERISEEEALKR